MDARDFIPGKVINEPGRIYPGALVRLRSGSPQMTVDSAVPSKDDGQRRWLCVWFNAGELHTAQLPESALAVDHGTGRGELPPKPRGEP